jgi:hypothetical protein
VSSQPSFEARSLSAPEYVLALHEPTDNVPVLLRNRVRGQTLQRIASAEAIASPEFQRWLTDQNRAGSDIFIGMNPLKDGASNRTKDNIKEVRHVYLDLDDDEKRPSRIFEILWTHLRHPKPCSASCRTLPLHKWRPS